MHRACHPIVTDPYVIADSLAAPFVHVFAAAAYPPTPSCVHFLFSCSRAERLSVQREHIITTRRCRRVHHACPPIVTELDIIAALLTIPFIHASAATL